MRGSGSSGCIIYDLSGNCNGFFPEWRKMCPRAGGNRVFCGVWGIVPAIREAGRSSAQRGSGVGVRADCPRNRGNGGPGDPAPTCGASRGRPARPNKVFGKPHVGERILRFAQNDRIGDGCGGRAANGRPYGVGRRGWGRRAGEGRCGHTFVTLRVRPLRVVCRAGGLGRRRYGEQKAWISRSSWRKTFASR